MIIKEGDVFRIRSKEWFIKTFGEPDEDEKVKIFNCGRWSLATCDFIFTVIDVGPADTDNIRSVTIFSDILGRYSLSDNKLFCIAVKLPDSDTMTNRQWLESLCDNELAVRINAFCLSSYHGAGYWNDWLKKKHGEAWI